MNKQYTMPTAEIVEFDTIDIITASGNSGSSGSGGGFEGEWDFDIPEVDLLSF